MLKSAKVNAIAQQMRSSRPQKECSSSTPLAVPVSITNKATEDLRQEVRDLKAEVRQMRKELDHLQGRQRPSVPVLLPKAGSNLGECRYLRFH